MELHTHKCKNRCQGLLLPQLLTNLPICNLLLAFLVSMGWWPIWFSFQPNSNFSLTTKSKWINKQFFFAGMLLNYLTQGFNIFSKLMEIWIDNFHLFLDILDVGLDLTEVIVDETFVLLLCSQINVVWCLMFFLNPLK